MLKLLVTLHEEHGLREYENKLLRRKFGPKIGEVNRRTGKIL
jgi:hypothetical protein